MTTETIIKEIVYVTAGDYDCFVTIDGQREYIGSAPSYHDGELKCDNYAYHYYADNHTPEVAAAIAVEALDPAPPAHRSITIGYDGEQCDLINITAQVLASLAHLRPSIGRDGAYLLLMDTATIPAPPDDRAIVVNLIDRLNEVVAQLPARPTSITAWLHVDDEIYQVGRGKETVV